MFEEILFQKSSTLRLDDIRIEQKNVVITVSSTSQQENCPYCHKTSSRIHSRYQRRPADLPVAGFTVRLEISVNRFFCLNDDCQCTTFAQRMPNFIQPYARRTNRLKQCQLGVAFAAGGKAGYRLLRVLGMPTSADTLLRLIRRAPEPDMATPIVLGVDDWAKKKGHSYGTILVDLEKRRPIDLLPSREAASVQRWLKAHPSVAIISRDRATFYINGATEGAPDALQVADRWHLLKNLRDNLKEWLETKPAHHDGLGQEGAQVIAFVKP